MAEHKPKVDPISPELGPEGQNGPEDIAPVKVPPTHAPIAVFDDDSMFNAADPQAAALSPEKRGREDQKHGTKTPRARTKQRKSA
jgi:hypothetical protein